MRQNVPMDESKWRPLIVLIYFSHAVIEILVDSRGN